MSGGGCVFLVSDQCLVDGAFDENFHRSARNLAKVSLLPAAGLNVYDVLRRDTLVMTKAAIKMIEERLA